MRVLPEQISKLQQQRDLWVEVNLKFDGRSKRLSSGMDTVISDTGGELPEAEPTRKALSRRLALLKTQANELAKTAPPTAYGDVSELLNKVHAQIKKKDWREAHVAVTKAERRFAVLVPLCQQWKALREALGQSALALEGLETLITRDEFAALKLKWDEAGQKVDEGIEALSMAPAQKLVEALDEALRLQRTQAEQRLTRLALLRIQCSDDHAALKRLAKRARAVGLDDMALRFEGLRDQMDPVPDDLDEGALQRLLERSAKEQSDSLSELGVQEAEVERQRRLARLQDIQRERDTLLQDNEEVLDAALQRMKEDVNEKLTALNELLSEGDPERILEIEDAWSAFSEEVDLLVDDMAPIAVLQDRLRQGLIDFGKITESQRQSKQEAWRKLSLAHQDLPAELLNPSQDGWAHLNVWEEFEFGRFFGALAGFLAGAEAAQRQAALDKHRKTYAGLKKEWEEQERHGTPAHKVRGTQATDVLGPLLVVDKKRTELSDPEQVTATTHLDNLRKLVDEVKKHRLAQQKKAKQIDGDDKGHSVKRHGPELSDKQLQNRLTTGMTPDGVFSPFKKSTRFINYDDLIDTRQKAFDEAVRLQSANFGPNLDRAPGPGGDTEYIVRVNHKRDVGKGFKGTGPTHTVKGKTGELYSAFVAITLTHTYTKICWESGRWRAVQHFPS